MVGIKPDKNETKRLQRLEKVEKRAAREKRKKMKMEKMSSILEDDEDAEDEEVPMKTEASVPVAAKAVDVPPPAPVVAKVEETIDDFLDVSGAEESDEDDIYGDMGEELPMPAVGQKRGAGVGGDGGSAAKKKR